MPLTQLDPTAALIVIDLQQGIVSVPTAHPTSTIVANSARLAEAFRARNLPVVLVNVVAAAPGRTDSAPIPHTFPEGWSTLVPELNSQPTDILISKHRRGAFIGTTLHEQLHHLGVTQVILTGISTSAGVDSTARSAHDLGYHVVIVTDATTDRDPATHTFFVENLFPRYTQTTTTQTLLQHLNP